MTKNNPSSVNRDRLAETIRQLDEKDLRFLNRMIVDRLKLINQARSTAMLSKFSVGDRVSFTTSTGEPRAGVVIRINKKTASIMTDEEGQWNVSPSLLTLEGNDFDPFDVDLPRLESREDGDE